MADLIESRPETSTQGALVKSRPEVLDRTSLLNEVSYVRDGASVLQEDASGLHHRVRNDELDELTATIARREPADVLEELATVWGVSWSTIARMTGVTATAVRKWRRGESISPTNRRSLARVLGVLEMLRRFGSPIGDPASWLEMPVSELATLTPIDLYLADRLDLLFDLGCENRAAHAVLDDLDSNWRETFSRDGNFMVVRGDDGAMIVERTD